MKRFHIILIGTSAIILIYSFAIYIRVSLGLSDTSFSNVFIWQFLTWIPWILFGQLINKLDHRYPIVEQSVFVWIIRHSVLCVFLMVVHLAWFVIISNNFSPFIGVENTGYGAFFFFFIMWTICDLLFYWVLLGVFALRQLLSISPVAEDQPNETSDYFLLKTSSRQSSVAIKDILWIEAEDYCCRVHTMTNNYLVRQSLNSFEKNLPEPDFQRIHRSTIVNTQYVEAIEKQENRRHVIRLRSGITRSISPEGRKKLQKILESR